MSLHKAASVFAAELNELFSACIDDQHLPRFGVVAETGVDDLVRIFPTTAPPKQQSMPLRRRCDEHGASLVLRVSYKCMIGSSGFLTIYESQYHVQIQRPGKGSPLPLLRVDYDRETQGDKPSSHVHFHAESIEYGWLVGSSGHPLQQPNSLHFPLGGRRFRPAVEDVLLFLNREGLFTEWKPGWRAAVDASLAQWHDRQVRATVVQHPEVAIEELMRIGRLPLTDRAKP